LLLCGSAPTCAGGLSMAPSARSEALGTEALPLRSGVAPNLAVGSPVFSPGRGTATSPLALADGPPAAELGASPEVSKPGAWFAVPAPWVLPAAGPLGTPGVVASWASTPSGSAPRVSRGATSLWAFALCVASLPAPPPPKKRANAGVLGGLSDPDVGALVGCASGSSISISTSNPGDALRLAAASAAAGGGGSEALCVLRRGMAKRVFSSGGSMSFIARPKITRPTTGRTVRHQRTRGQD
jgi:hypothetical protein